MKESKFSNNLEFQMELTEKSGSCYTISSGVGGKNNKNQKLVSWQNKSLILFLI